VSIAEPLPGRAGQPQWLGRQQNSGPTKPQAPLGTSRQSQLLWKMKRSIMTVPSADQSLSNTLLEAKLSEETIRDRVQLIQTELLTHSRYVREANFRSIHPDDLDFLFRRYDALFFEGLCRTSLAAWPLRFRFSRRMTSAGGRTARYTTPAGEVSFEIAIASSTLFDGFGAMDRLVTVCGIACRSRLEALQRVFEHEMVHLAEQLAWGTSNCSEPRFQGIAARFFLHRSHTHALITRRERAAEAGIRIGSMVVFRFEGRELIGRVNRITKRATVLVTDPAGRAYSDGSKYKTYYVPLAALRLAMAQGQS
jgi:hypothetical protein